MPRRLAKASVLEVIMRALVAPRVDGVRDVGVALGQVFAGRAARVGELALGGPGGGVGGEGGVPGEGGGVVVGAVGVGAVEDGGFEGAVRGVLRGGGVGGVGGGGCGGRGGGEGRGGGCGGVG